MSRMVPGGARPEWPHDPERGRGGAREAPGRYGYDGERDVPGGQPGYGRGQYGQGQQQGQPQQGQPQQGQQGQPQSYNGQGYNGREEYGGRGQRGYGQQQGQGRPGYGQQGYGQRGQGRRGQGQYGRAPESYNGQGQGYGGQRPRPQPETGNTPPRGYRGDRGRADARRHEMPGLSGQYGDTQRIGVPWQQEEDSGRYPGEPPYQGAGDQGPRRRPGQRPPARKVRFRRIRRLYRRRYVRLGTAIVAVFAVFVLFSAGQATFKNNGQSLAANLAEWARDHGLGPVVTLGEYLTYSPPPKGGKPSFSLAVPKSEQVAAKATAKKKGFQPDIPATVKSLAGAPIAGEGQWRVVEKVHGQPAIFTTFLRDATYTSQVNGIASMDPRLVKFQMHPGSEDPGPGNWGPWGSDYIPQGSRTGLLATFNGGFKLNSAMGGFYLNGNYHGSLVKGAASVVYYKDGTIKIGSWGQEVTMTPQVEGVRQNLKLLVDHGKIAPNLNQNIETNFGATLGGGYFVWRSGLGITKDGRVIYVYGPALDVQDLAELLHQAGAIEGMQMDINPYWMKYEYYTVKGNPADPVPTNLLPTQQQSAYTYYSPYTRDFTAVYAR